MSRTSGALHPDPLPIRSLAFLGGMAEADGWRPPPELPEVAFAGRSNVGKSSLLNSLVRRRGLARTSRTPGRTREINFFRVNDDFVLVDLPGYGYARVAKERRATWRPLLDGYFRRTPALRGTVLLLDARRDPTDDDRAMLDYLAEHETPTLIAVTKIDKLSREASAKRVRTLAQEFALAEAQIIPFSARTGEGRDELAHAIVSLLQSADDT